VDLIERLNFKITYNHNLRFSIKNYTQSQNKNIANKTVGHHDRFLGGNIC